MQLIRNINNGKNMVILKNESNELKDWAWCKVFHQLTENFKIGILNSPKRIKKDKKKEFLYFFAINRFIKKNNKNSKNKMRLVVNRESHAHKTPQVDFPQKLPESKVKKLKNTPNFIKIWLKKLNIGIWVTKKATLKKEIIMYKPTASHAQGTCIKKILKFSPCCKSNGIKNKNWIENKPKLKSQI